MQMMSLDQAVTNGTHRYGPPESGSLTDYWVQQDL